MKLSVRVEGDQAWICDDDGTARTLTPQQAAELAGWWDTAAPDTDPLSATLRAELAQARHAAPVQPERHFEPQPTTSGARIAIGTNVSPIQTPLGAVLDQRVSRRRFGRLFVVQLAALLTHGARVKEVRAAPSGFVDTHRPAPSAGARHPCDLHLIAGDNIYGLDAGAYRFDPVSAELERLDHPPAGPAKALDRIEDGIGARPAAALFLVADLERTFTRYPTGMSLIWRDAGALLATLHLVATALDLHSCVLGSCGTWIDQPPRAIDLGCLAVGGSVTGG